MLRLDLCRIGTHVKLINCGISVGLVISSTLSIPEHIDDLFIARVKEGRAHFVNELLIVYRHNININYENKNLEFPLYIASKSGYSEVVEVLLQSSYLDINRRHDNGSTALWIASAGEHYGVVQLLLEHPGTNLTKGMADNQDVTLEIAKLIYDNAITKLQLGMELLVASVLGNSEKVDELIQHSGSVINSMDQYHRTPLFWASTRGHTQVVQVLLGHDQILINVAKSTTGGTALFQAAKYGYSEIISLLLKQSQTDVNIGLITTETPLHIASKNGHERVVSLLLSQSNIDVNTGAKTPLMAASKNGNSEIVKSLLENADTDVNIATFDGKTALFYATESLAEGCVDYLLRCPKTDPKLLDDHYKTALDYVDVAWWHENFTANQISNITELFDRRGYIQEVKGHTCCSKNINRGLFIAISLKDTPWIKTFHQCQAIDLNIRNHMGNTPLNLATKKGLKDIVEILLRDPRIDVNKEDSGQRENALTIASEMRHVDILKMVLSHPQTFVNKMNLKGHSALTLVLKSYSVEMFRVVKLLLRCPKVEIPSSLSSAFLSEDYGLELKQVYKLISNNRYVALTCCQGVRQGILGSAMAGDYRAVRGLLQCPGTEANVNTLDQKGRTPLYVASMLGHLETVEVLLDNSNVDVNIGSTLCGGTAFSVASKKLHREIMKVLIAHTDVDVGKGWALDEWTGQVTSPREKSSQPTSELSRPTPATSNLPSNRFRDHPLMMTH